MKYLNFSFIILLFSCQNNAKKYAIEEVKDLRHEIGLLELDERFKLDSTYRFQPYDETYLSYNKKIADDENPSSFYIIDHYSDGKEKYFKTVILKKSQNQIKIISEEDKYYRKVNDSIETFLIINHNYLKNASSYRLDSLATDRFIQANWDKLKIESKRAKELNAYICGTAAQEILERGFPQRHAFLNQAKFIEMRELFEVEKEIKK